MKYSIEELKEELRKYLSDYRYNHSIMVMEEAKKYLNIYCPNEEFYDQTIRAALMHDIMKELSDEEALKYITYNNIDIDFKKDKVLVHGVLGADLCLKKYDFTNDMAQAIRWHTTGHNNMSLMDKIVFLADKTGRSNLSPALLEIREIAFINLDKAICMYLEKTIERLKNKGASVNVKSLQLLKLLKKC